MNMKTSELETIIYEELQRYQKEQPLQLNEEDDSSWGVKEWSLAILFTVMGGKGVRTYIRSRGRNAKKFVQHTNNATKIVRTASMSARIAATFRTQANRIEQSFARLTKNFDDVVHGVTQSGKITQNTFNALKDALLRNINNHKQVVRTAMREAEKHLASGTATAAEQVTLKAFLKESGKSLKHLDDLGANLARSSTAAELHATSLIISRGGKVGFRGTWLGRKLPFKSGAYAPKFEIKQSNIVKMYKWGKKWIGGGATFVGKLVYNIIIKGIAVFAIVSFVLSEVIRHLISEKWADNIVDFMKTVLGKTWVGLVMVYEWGVGVGLNVGPDIAVAEAEVGDYTNPEKRKALIRKAFTGSLILKFFNDKKYLAFASELTKHWELVFHGAKRRMVDHEELAANMVKEIQATAGIIRNEKDTIVRSLQSMTHKKIKNGMYMAIWVAFLNSKFNRGAPVFDVKKATPKMGSNQHCEYLLTVVDSIESLGEAGKVSASATRHMCKLGGIVVQPDGGPISQDLMNKMVRVFLRADSWERKRQKVIREVEIDLSKRVVHAAKLVEKT